MKLTIMNLNFGTVVLELAQQLTLIGTNDMLKTDNDVSLHEGSSPCIRNYYYFKIVKSKTDLFRKF